MWAVSSKKGCDDVGEKLLNDCPSPPSSSGKSPVKINIKEIPKIETRLISSATLKSVLAFYENPQNLADANKWIQQQKAKAKQKDVI